MRIEFHFQDGFTGQDVTITTADRILAEITATTRLMTGLAEIVPLDLQHREEVRLRVGADPALTETVSIDAATPFVTINLVDGALRVAREGRRPGYV